MVALTLGFPSGMGEGREVWSRRWRRAHGGRRLTPGAAWLLERVQPSPARLQGAFTSYVTDLHQSFVKRCSEQVFSSED